MQGHRPVPRDAWDGDCTPVFKIRDIDRNLGTPGAAIVHCCQILGTSTRSFLRDGDICRKNWRLYTWIIIYFITGTKPRFNPQRVFTWALVSCSQSATRRSAFNSQNQQPVINECRHTCHQCTAATCTQFTSCPVTPHLKRIGGPA